MTTFLDVLKDMQDINRVSKAGSFGAALDAHQKMQERHQLRDAAAALQESVAIQRELLDNARPQPADVEQSSNGDRRANEQKRRDTNVMKQIMADMNRLSSQEPQIVIGTLAKVVEELPPLLQHATAFGNPTVASNVSAYDAWYENRTQTHKVDKAREAEVTREMEAIESKWFKSAADVERLQALGQQREMLRTMNDNSEGFFDEQLLQEYPHVCKHYRFGLAELLATEIHKLKVEFDRSIENIDVKRFKADKEGLLTGLDSAVARAKTLIQNSPTSLSSRCVPATTIDSSIAASGPSNRDNDSAIDLCLRACCLVAAVDNTLKDAEVRYIVNELLSRDAGRAAESLRVQIISTCKQIAKAGYADSAKALVTELIPLKGRPLAALVLELMESVATADGQMGNREQQVLDYFRKKIGN